MTEASDKEVLLARRMHREGASLETIHKTLGWTCTLHTTQERLQRAGVKIRAGKRRLAHMGESTTTCTDFYDKTKARKKEA